MDEATALDQNASMNMMVNDNLIVTMIIARGIIMKMMEIGIVGAAIVDGVTINAF